MEKNSLMDILLIPKAYFRKLNDNILTLYLGIIFIGLFDMSILLSDNLVKFFIGKPGNILLYNISLFLCFVVFIGVVDVCFFCFPLFDFFKMFKVKEKITSAKVHLIRFMKTYIISHIPIIPLKIVLIFVGQKAMGNDVLMEYVYVVDGVLIGIWHCAIIIRGIYTLYGFSPKIRGLLFAGLYLWSLILGSVITFSVDKWFLLLFK